MEDYNCVYTFYSRQAQFMILIIHFGVPVLLDNCYYSKMLSVWIVGLMSLLVIMFVDFYRKTYGWRLS